MLHKRIKPEKARIQKIFIAIHHLKSKLATVSVRGEDRKIYQVMDMFRMTDGYIPKLSDKFKADTSGGYSLENSRVYERLQTKSLGVPWTCERKTTEHHDN